MTNLRSRDDTIDRLEDTRAQGGTKKCSNRIGRAPTTPHPIPASVRSGAQRRRRAAPGRVPERRRRPRRFGHLLLSLALWMLGAGCLAMATSSLCRSGGRVGPGWSSPATSTRRRKRWRHHRGDASGRLHRPARTVLENVVGSRRLRFASQKSGVVGMRLH